MKNLFFINLVILLILACSSNNELIDFNDNNTDSNTDNNNNNEAEYNLLFIGNSLTYSNNLPALVKNIAIGNGKDVEVNTIAYGNYALVDHWNYGEIQTHIESGKYDFVIVQQGPSSQLYGRGLLIEYGGYISSLCNDNNAKLAYYMVWPSLHYYHTYNGVIESYTLAANATNSILCPVGEVWKSYFDETEDFSYYSADGFHPSLKGSNVAAQVIYESLFNN